MEIYILQADYKCIDTEAYWDDDNGYVEEEYDVKDVLFVSTNLRDAVARLYAETKTEEGRYYCHGYERSDGYQIFIGDTETGKISLVPNSSWKDIFNEIYSEDLSKELGCKVKINH